MVRRIVVTGGMGFIGSNFIRHWMDKYSEDLVLNIDCETVGANPKNLEGYSDKLKYCSSPVDIRNKAELSDVISRFQPHGIFHFAAQSHVDRSITDPESFVATNVMGTLNLLECATKLTRAAGARFVYVDTDEIWGDLPNSKASPFNERSEIRPSSPYSASKAAGGLLALSYHRTYDFDVVVTNSTNNYGPRQFKEKLIPTVILNAIQRQPIPVYGNGQNIRDWIWVGDNCEAIDRVFHQGESGSRYCVGGGNERTNIDLVRKICGVLDEVTQKEEYHDFRFDRSFDSLITFVGDRPGHDVRYAVSTARVRRELSWVPKMGIDEGLKRTVQWYLDILKEEIDATSRHQ